MANLVTQTEPALSYRAISARQVLHAHCPASVAQSVHSMLMHLRTVWSTSSHVYISITSILVMLRGECHADSNSMCIQDQAATPQEAGQEEDSLSIIDDELDSHDCMLPLIHLVEKAAALFQASHKQPGGAMPEWMKRMHDAVASGDVPKYGRLFLVKVVLHVDRRHAERQDAEQVGLHRKQHG